MSYSSHSRRYTESSYQEHLKNLYKIISRDSDLTRFSARIDETDPLIKCILKLDDPLTVFAPTNKSFEKPIQICDTIEEAIKYHTIPRYLPPNKLCNNKLYNTLADRRQVRINTYCSPKFKDVMTINGVKIVDYDIKAENGYLYKIDQVLCPPTQSIIDIVCNNTDFSVLKTALEAANLVGLMMDPEASFTVFAPTNEAFERLALSLKVPLLSVINYFVDNPEYLASVLGYHILTDEVLFSAAIKKGETEIKASNNGRLTITSKCKNGCKRLYITDKLCRKAKVEMTDILATNGVIHVISEVLLPSTK